MRIAFFSQVDTSGRRVDRGRGMGRALWTDADRGLEELRLGTELEMFDRCGFVQLAQWRSEPFVAIFHSA